MGRITRGIGRKGFASIWALAAVIAFAALSLFPATAWCASIRFDINGHLTSVPAVLTGSFSSGDPFFCSYIFESDAPVIGGGFTTGSGYADYDARDWTTTVGSQYSATAANVLIRVVNNYTIDNVTVAPLNPIVQTGVPAGFTPPGYGNLGIEFQDFTNAALPSTALPTTPSDLSGLQSRYNLTFFLAPASRQMLGSADTITATVVPEPASLSLLALGGLTLLRRRRVFKRDIFSN